MYDPKTLTELYSGKDLAALFRGDFINFGYWKNIPAIISENDVITANKNLYCQVFKRLALSYQDKVLEIGSGHGAGCALLSSLYATKSIIGLDYLTTHIDHAQKKHSDLIESGKIKFLQGSAEAIPVPDSSINKIYTIEAFQHFNTQSAIREFYRVLAPDGKLIISTFFCKSKSDFEELATLLPRPAILSDSSREITTVSEVLSLLNQYSFQTIKLENISDYVWLGYDRWVMQNDPGIWDMNWKIAFDKGLLDYYIITANLKNKIKIF